MSDAVVVLEVREGPIDVGRESTTSGNAMELGGVEGCINEANEEEVAEMQLLISSSKSELKAGEATGNPN